MNLLLMEYIFSSSDYLQIGIVSPTPSFRISFYTSGNHCRFQTKYEHRDEHRYAIDVGNDDMAVVDMRGTAGN